MALSFPLFLSQFWIQLRFAGRPEFNLVQYQKQSTTAGGDILTAKFGEPKWVVDVALERGMHDDNQRVLAMIKALLGRNGTFLAFDIRQSYPAYDPDGSIIDGHTVQVRTKGSDNKSLSLKGLAGPYELAVGEKIVVMNADGKRAMLELMESITATSGNTDEFEVQPFLPAWLAVNDEVLVARPSAKFKIVPGSYKASTGDGNLADGASFQMISVP